MGFLKTCFGLKSLKIVFGDTLVQCSKNKLWDHFPTLHLSVLSLLPRSNMSVISKRSKKSLLCPTVQLQHNPNPLSSLFFPPFSQLLPLLSQIISKPMILPLSSLGFFVLIFPLFLIFPYLRRFSAIVKSLIRFCFLVLTASLIDP